MLRTIALAFTLTAGLVSAQPTAGDTITAVESGTAFRSNSPGAPLDFEAGDTFTFTALSDAADGRLLVHFRDGTPAYRAYAEAFGIDRPDPYAVTRGSRHETRYVHGTVNVRSGPGTSHSRLGSLNRDDTVYVLTCHAGWCRVEIPTATETNTRAFISESLLHTSPAPVRTYAPARTYSGSSSRSVAVRCSGTTQRGTRCLRQTTNRSGRCWQH
ncbi:MAG: hypothetical protein CL433_13160 [Acidimicrobiaceae bacterium]|nr:hypothetical protein [Acidimicrobiaceae bacterium]